MKQGFTLIELLVVVLIIGILSSVALPQYTKAVEKSRSAEALQNAKALSQGIDMFILEDPNSSGVTQLKDLSLPIELSGGKFEGDTYITKNFTYDAWCSHGTSEIEIIRYPSYYYSFVLQKNSSTGPWEKYCFTQKTDLGRTLCKSMQANGYIYKDDER